jgi:sporulation protein YlmC with PRC-barrel domain
MRIGNDLIGKHIISITDGKLLGDVKDLYFDHAVENITAVFVGSEGLFRKKTFFIKRESIYVFGIDAILVKDSDVVLDSSQYAPAADWLRLNTLKGRAIDTPGGTKVGKVGDVIVNEDAQVIGVALSRIAVEGTIAERRSVSRAAVLDMGEEDGIVTVDLEQAELLDLAPAVKAEDVAHVEPSSEEIEVLMAGADLGEGVTSEEE